MFGKLFGKKKQAVEDEAEQQQAAPEEAGTIDSVAQMRLGADELVQRLMTGMTTERGIHIESLLAVLGSLAGFCCIDSTLKQVAALGRDSRECGIADVETADGSRYYFGDPINALLGESNVSIWALTAGVINHLGSQDYPNFAEIAGHVAATIGGPEFGKPRVPEQHQPGDLPINYVRDLWPHVLPIVERYAPAYQERATMFGMAIQKVIDMGKDVIPPATAGKLVMECAVPMAKLDPARVWA